MVSVLAAGAFWLLLVPVRARAKAGSPLLSRMRLLPQSRWVGCEPVVLLLLSFRARFASKWIDGVGETMINTTRERTTSVNHCRSATKCGTWYVVRRTGFHIRTLRTIPGTTKISGVYDVLRYINFGAAGGGPSPPTPSLLVHHFLRTWYQVRRTSCAAYTTYAAPLLSRTHVRKSEPRSTVPYYR